MDCAGGGLTLTRGLTVQEVKVVSSFWVSKRGVFREGVRTNGALVPHRKVSQGFKSVRLYDFRTVKKIIIKCHPSGKSYRPSSLTPWFCQKTLHFQ
jgi:hypothetical protein